MTGGTYRVTATWVLTRGDAEPTWLLHVEHMDEHPGFRSVHWSYRTNLDGLEDFVRSVAAGTPGRPTAERVTFDFVLPPEIHSMLDRARRHEADEGDDGVGAARARRLRRDARRALVEQGVTHEDLECVMNADPAAVSSVSNRT